MNISTQCHLKRRTFLRGLGSVEQMQEVYDQHKGFTGLNVDESGCKLTK